MPRTTNRVSGFPLPPYFALLSLAYAAGSVLFEFKFPGGVLHQPLLVIVLASHGHAHDNFGKATF